MKGSVLLTCGECLVHVGLSRLWGRRPGEVRVLWFGKEVSLILLHRMLPS